MTKELPFAILPQPTETTCGATCLHAVYSYFGEKFELQQLIDEIPQLPDGGGTRAAYLGLHALKLGYEVRMYTYNLPVFDLTWFRHGEGRDLQRRLRLQLEAKGGDELAEVTEIFCHYLDAGGEIYTEDLTSSLMRRYLKRDIPIITGLSITYLHGSPREIQSTNTPDAISGTPTGHFVVVYGYDKKKRVAQIADPYMPNPFGGNYYSVGFNTLVCAILLGVVTYEANLLMIRPPSKGKISS